MLSTVLGRSNVTPRHLLIMLWIKTLTRNFCLFAQWWLFITIPFYSDLVTQCLCWNDYDGMLSPVIVSVLSFANIDSILKSFIFFFLLLAPPAFIKKPPTFVEVLLGDSLTLSCGAHGNPRPTVVWHKDDSQIEKHEKIKVSCMSRCHNLYLDQIDDSFCYCCCSFKANFFSVMAWSSWALPLIASSGPHPLPHSLLGSEWYLVFGLRH